MTLQQEFRSWFAPPRLELSPNPRPGDKAPSSEKLQVPGTEGKPAIVTFLRHCGCPFAERDFKRLRSTAEQHPDIRCVAISHSSQDATEKWFKDVGGPGRVQVVVDDERKVYAQWGLGVSGWAHLGPGALLTLYKLYKKEGISKRPTESGSRWQTAGNWAVDSNGAVTWGGPAARSDEEVRFEDAVVSLSRSGGSKL